MKPKQALKDFLDKENDFEYLDEPYTILEEQKHILDWSQWL